MVDRDVVLEKVAQIQNCLKRIRDKTKNNPKTLNEFDVQDIFVLNLQRAIQSVIDLAAHVVSDEGLGLPEDIKTNFTLLEKARWINKTLAEKMRHMVGFRNIAVHDYSAIDPEILKSILKKNLSDLEKFYAQILSKMKK